MTALFFSGPCGGTKCPEKHNEWLCSYKKGLVIYVDAIDLLEISWKAETFSPIWGGGGSPYTQDVWINTYITLAVQMQQAGWHWLTSEQTLLNKEEWTEELNWWGSVSSCRPVWYQEENVSKWPRITRFKKEHAGDLPPDRVSWVQKFPLNISGIPKLPRPCLGNSLPTTLLLNSHCHITWKVKRIG